VSGGIACVTVVPEKLITDKRQNAKFDYTARGFKRIETEDDVVGGRPWVAETRKET
jgi:hypothetical protein